MDRKPIHNRKLVFNLILILLLIIMTATFISGGNVIVRNGIAISTDLNISNVVHYDVSNSRLGVGTGSPNATLHVRSTAGDGAFHITNGDDDNHLFVERTTGRVAMGTTSPVSLFQIDDTSADTVNISNTFFINGQDTEVSIGIDESDGKLHVHRATAGSIDADNDVDEIVVEDSTDMGMSLLSPDANYATYAFGSPSDSIGARIDWKFNDAELGINTDATSGFITFSTENTSEKMRIESGGDVGIGLTNPTVKLHVQKGATGGSVNGDAQIAVENAGNTGIQILSPNTVNGSLFFGDPEASGVGEIFYNHATNAMVFVTAATEQMTINGLGDVGVGNTNPARALHITDTMRLDGRSGAPSSPVFGDLYADSDVGEFCFYNSTHWVGLVYGGNCA